MNDGQGIELLGPGFVSVLNTTFGANGLGGLRVPNIYASDGFMSITHSYVPDAIGPSITTRGNGHIAVKSSIVGPGCGGLVVNLGPNLGECFGGDEVELENFGDNGCVTPTPNGCVLTPALPEGSPAIGTGNCVDVAIYNPETKEFARQDVLTDQRGEARKPACDIGPFETEALPMCLGQVPTHYVVPGEAFVGTHGADVIFGTPGNDIIDGAGGDDLICGFEGDDVISGGDGDDVMTGGPGRDIVRDNPGSDTIQGGEGDDRLLGGTGDDTINGDAGDDYIGGFGGNDIIRGGDGNEKIYGGFGADVIFGHDGDDAIHGLIGDDVIEGGNGNDEIYGDRGNDAVRGGDGDDIVKGGNANDEVVGGPGNDELHGGKADDRIIGGLGTDLCIGNAQKIADTHTGCEETFGFP
jgi:Ca2+-binding RTX toxin-like protein